MDEQRRRSRSHTAIPRAVLTALFLISAATGGAAEELYFGPDLTASGWAVVKYPRIRPAGFRARDPDTLDVATDASAGMLWRALTPGLRDVHKAKWRWRADAGVGPSDLAIKGADDRVLAVYFIFGRERDIGATPMRMLASSSVTALAYVFGGDKPRATIVPSPHMGDRGKFVILRPADAAKRTWYDETVDFFGDYTRAFKRTPSVAIAVAISSDSDDSKGRNRASISRFVVER
jgi:Protein of unknown function (DUF3047)